MILRCAQLILRRSLKSSATDRRSDRDQPDYPAQQGADWNPLAVRALIGRTIRRRVHTDQPAFSLLGSLPFILGDAFDEVHVFLFAGALGDGAGLSRAFLGEPGCGRVRHPNRYRPKSRATHCFALFSAFSTGCHDASRVSATICALRRRRAALSRSGYDTPADAGIARAAGRKGELLRDHITRVSAHISHCLRCYISASTNAMIALFDATESGRTRREKWQKNNSSNNKTSNGRKNR